MKSKSRALRSVSAAALVVAMLAATGRAEDAKPAPASPSALAPERLEAFLKEAGYAPFDPAKTGWAVYSKHPHVNPQMPEAKEGLFVRVGMGESKEYVILSASMALGKDVEIPREVLLDMLRFNAGDSGMQFCLAKREKGEKLAVALRFIDNRALTAFRLEDDVEDFFVALRKTYPIWDPASWGKAGLLGGDPAKNGAMEGGK